MVSEMTRTLVLLLFAFLAGCASQPHDPELVVNDGTLTNTEYAMQGSQSASLVPASGLSVCDPSIVDRRAALDANCLNRIEHAPTTRERYHAVGREVKEQRSLCDHMWLPKCRRKY